MSKPAYSILAWLLLSATEAFAALMANILVYMGRVYNAAPRHADAALGAIIPISSHGDLRYMRQGQLGRIMFCEFGAFLCGLVCVIALVVIDMHVLPHTAKRSACVTWIFPAVLAAASVYYWEVLA